MDDLLRHNHGHDHDHDTEGVLMAKGVSMAVLFVASMICGFMPMVLSKKFKWMQPADATNLKTRNNVVMTLLSFGGGVLLSVTFMHLMPEVDKNVEYLECEYFGLFPFIIIFYCGFIAFFINFNKNS